MKTSTPTDNPAPENPDRPWTQNPPTDQGTYWHWNGDIDCAPLPVFVLWSGTTGKCFVSTGQLGITEPVDCDQYGGWWRPLYAPPLPTESAAKAKRDAEEESALRAENKRLREALEKIITIIPWNYDDEDGAIHAAKDIATDARAQSTAKPEGRG